MIDVQNEYFEGALPISDPPPQTSLANIGRAMDAATAAGLPVIVVQHSDDDPHSPIFRKGTSAWALRPEIEQRPRDHLVEKAFPGTFTDTPLEGILESAGVEKVAIVGYMTHMCVDTTASTPNPPS